jgi:hypothetical protein
MDKRSMQLLEKAFIAEIEEGAHGVLGLIQTKSKLAQKLEAEGYLVKDQHTYGGRFPVTVHGYRLTHLGRLTYCATSEGEVQS